MGHECRSPQEHSRGFPVVGYLQDSQEEVLTACSKKNNTIVRGKKSRFIVISHGTRTPVSSVVIAGFHCSRLLVGLPGRSPDYSLKKQKQKKNAIVRGKKSQLIVVSHGTRTLVSQVEVLVH